MEWLGIVHSDGARFGRTYEYMSGWLTEQHWIEIHMGRITARFGLVSSLNIQISHGQCGELFIRSYEKLNLFANPN